MGAEGPKWDWRIPVSDSVGYATEEYLASMDLKLRVSGVALVLFREAVGTYAGVSQS